MQRVINIGLEPPGETLGVGDWLLVQVGFAMAKIDAAEAQPIGGVRWMNCGWS